MNLSGSTKCIFSPVMIFHWEYTHLTISPVLTEMYSVLSKYEGVSCKSVKLISSGRNWTTTPCAASMHAYIKPAHGIILQKYLCLYNTHECFHHVLFAEVCVDTACIHNLMCCSHIWKSNTWMDYCITYTVLKQLTWTCMSIECSTKQQRVHVFLTLYPATTWTCCSTT